MLMGKKLFYDRYGQIIDDSNPAIHGGKSIVKEIWKHTRLSAIFSGGIANKMYTRVFLVEAASCKSIGG
jgi:hypothetical protein